MDFPCIACGLCCQALTEETLPSLYSGSNVCRHFDSERGLCSNYDDRPLICRVEDSWKRTYKSVMSEKEFYLMNLDCCMQLAKHADRSDLVRRIETERNKLIEEID